MADPCIFFVKLPPTQKLCHVVLKIEEESNQPQTQVLKCRQLLFLCRDVMASPNIFDGSILDVVMSLSYFKEKKLHPYCKKLGLKPIHASPIMLSVLQECFVYTLRFKVSSLWIVISKYLVKGPDIVNCRDKQEAVDLEITVSDEQMTIAIRPYAIRNPPPRLDEFDICFQALQNFREDPSGIIQPFSIHRSWCHVMPSMKRGQLVEVRRSICRNNQHLDMPTPFQDYQGLKKYWKNHHGIKLPEKEDGLMYGSIYFKLIGDQLFTYPLCCLRTREIQVMPRCDGPAIIKDFMASVNQKMAGMCGFKLLYSSKPCYVNSTLSEVSRVASNDVIPATPLENSNRDRRDADVSNSQVIKSSQPSQQGKNPGLIKKMLDGLPKTSDGKYIPVFAHKKQNVKNTADCAKKINAEMAKKKTPNFMKKHSTPSQVTKDIPIISATVGKKFKTPRQDIMDMNDSGISSDETPIIMAKESLQNKIAKKLQPKKLTFDRISNAATCKTSPCFQASVKKHKSVNLGNIHLVNGIASENVETLSNDVSKSKNIARKLSFRRTTEGTSPLKVMKNHSFDQLFSKAGSRENYQDSGNFSFSNEKPSAKILKNHSFDKLFSKATNVTTHDDTADSHIHNDSGISFTQNSPLKIMENHRFDEIFKPAKCGLDDASRLNGNSVEHSFKNVGSYHQIDGIFSGLATPENNFKFHAEDPCELFRTKHIKETVRDQPSCAMKQQYSLKDTLQRIMSDSGDDITTSAGTNEIISSGIASINSSSVEPITHTKATKPVKKRLGVGMNAVNPKKPKIQSVDVEEMARMDMLKKVNAPTLMSWLRSNGVSVTTRDKKDDLVAKIKLQIMVKSKENLVAAD